MYEKCLDAIVIDREDAGEADSYVFLYTQELGKIKTKAKSVRKITSRLAAHLQPGDLSRVRLVGKSEDSKFFQLVDALVVKRLGLPLDILQFVKDLTLDNEPDEKLWNVFLSGDAGKRRILQVLGWDPEHAWCSYCDLKTVRYFSETSQSFACHSCIRRVDQNEVLYEI